MRIFAVLAVATMAIGATACGGRTRPAFAPNDPALTSATITFFNQDEGKDSRSTATVELLRGSSELAGETRATGMHFEHDTTTAPISLTLTSGRFYKNDIPGSRVRIRLAPDGRDTWTFNCRVSLAFSDGTVENYGWTGLRLDNSSAETTLTFANARVP